MFTCRCKNSSLAQGILNLAPNSALDLTVRPVTPVARAQRARQSVPQVSAGVRQTHEESQARGRRRRR